MKVKQQGVAIVLAMGVVAMAAIGAMAILVTQSTWSRESKLTADHVQAQAIIAAGVDWGRAVLSDDRHSSSIDHLGEPWALRLAPIPVENGELAGYIDDQQGKFNLNNLVSAGKVNPSEFAYFQRLLSLLGLPGELADALADWIDADNVPHSPRGAEDSYYLTLEPPYLAANRPLIDMAELALVRGFDSNVCARLRPFVTALPRNTAVNVNTASPEVIAAIVKGMDLDGARGLVAQRNRAYFRNADDFAGRLPKGRTVAAEDVAVGSNYFLMTLRVRIGEAEAHGSALLARDDSRWPVVLWRKYL